MKFKTDCGQRGCVAEVECDDAPVFCPVCNQPLLEGGVAPVEDAKTSESKSETDDEKTSESDSETTTTT